LYTYVEHINEYYVSQNQNPIRLAPVTPMLTPSIWRFEKNLREPPCCYFTLCRNITCTEVSYWSM